MTSPDEPTTAPEESTRPLYGLRRAPGPPPVPPAVPRTLAEESATSSDGPASLWGEPTSRRAEPEAAPAEPVALWGDLVPARTDPAPTEEGPTHAQAVLVSAAPVDSWAEPVRETADEPEPVAVHDEPAPVHQEPDLVPAWQGSAPAWEDWLPPWVPEEPAVAAEEPAVALHEPSPAHDEPVAAPEEPAVAAEEPPAVCEEPPAVCEEPAAVRGEPAPPPGAARPRRRGYVALRTAGQLLVTAAAVVVLVVVYQLFVTDLFADRSQERLAEEIRTEWEEGDSRAAPRPAMPGDALAVLYVPRLGADYRRVVVEGTDIDDLAQGPGHYTDSALPGDRGNFAVAGHRDGKGSPFKELDELRPGDPIVVETADTWFVYRVLGDPERRTFTGDASGIPGRQIVGPQDVQVISPTPNDPDGAATGNYLTLTTCHPEYSARQRLVIHAVLDGVGTPKSELPDGPSALHAS